jgi:hypothetical protein
MPFPTSRRPIERFSGSATSVSSSTITTISDVPASGFIVRIHVVKTSGSASTIAPILSEDSAVTAAVSQIAEATAAAHVDEVPVSPISYSATDNKLYLKHVPSSASDNAVSYAIDIWPSG